MSHDPNEEGRPLEAGVHDAEDSADGGAPTGHADVDRALARLSELDSMQTAEHVSVFEDVHARLQQAMSDLDGS